MPKVVQAQFQARKMHDLQQAYPDAYALGTGAQVRCDTGRPADVL